MKSMELSVRKGGDSHLYSFHIAFNRKNRDIKDFILITFVSYKAILGKLVVLSVFFVARICAQNEVEVKLL